MEWAYNRMSENGFIVAMSGRHGTCPKANEHAWNPPITESSRLGIPLQETTQYRMDKLVRYMDVTDMIVQRLTCE